MTALPSPGPAFPLGSTCWLSLGCPAPTGNSLVHRSSCLSPPPCRFSSSWCPSHCVMARKFFPPCSLAFPSSTAFHEESPSPGKTLKPPDRLQKRIKESCFPKCLPWDISPEKCFWIEGLSGHFGESLITKLIFGWSTLLVKLKISVGEVLCLKKDESSNNNKNKWGLTLFTQSFPGDLY